MQVREMVAVGMSVTALSACASVRPLTSMRASAIARQRVCGSPGSTTDAACAVESTTAVKGGYRVVVMRQPPAGNDRIAVTVQRGGKQVLVTEIDAVAVPGSR